MKIDRSIPLDVLWSYSHVDPERGCFLWHGLVDAGGYGKVGFAGNSVKVHRLSYQSFIGPIPPGKLVCHHCDVRNCWAPHHIYAGTYKQNAGDRQQRGRSATGKRHGIYTQPKSRWAVASGEQHGHAKLTYQIARRMRYRHTRGLSTVAELAREYGVNHVTVQQVIDHRTWEKRRDRRQAKHPAC
jgi:hypothetical protein